MGNVIKIRDKEIRYKCYQNEYKYQKHRSILWSRDLSPRCHSNLTPLRPESFLGAVPRLKEVGVVADREANGGGLAFNEDLEQFLPPSIQ